MLGIDDPLVALAYLLCVLGTILCAVYGLVMWNRGDEPTETADRRWAAHEKQVEDEL